MDFLDPKRRKAHRRRLFIGYVLMSIVIAIGTMVILYLAYGYDIDRKTGSIIQNGIVFVDSEPGGAQIYVNDVLQGSRTDTRMALPAGEYTVRLEAEGYRTWERTFTLEGGQIQRLVYPFLLPESLSSEEIREYSAVPQLISQSPDRRWVLIQQPGQAYAFDMYDLNDPERQPVRVSVPVTLLSEPTRPSTLSEVEWAGNNRHVLLRRKAEGINEYIMFDREKPAESVNINQVLGINPVEVTLRDNHFERIYYLDARPGTLRSADLKARTISAPVASDVTFYKTYLDNLVLFTSSDDETPEGKIDFKIAENDKTYNLRSLSKSERPILNLSRYDGKFYFVIGSGADNIAYVYENPLPVLKREVSEPLSVFALMRLTNPQSAKFAPGDQYIMLQSDNKILTLDLYDKQQYQTVLDHEFPAGYQIKWMDAHRLQYLADGQSYMIDFDGSNEQALVTSDTNFGPYFDPDFEYAFSLSSSRQPDGQSFWMTPLRTNL